MKIEIVKTITDTGDIWYDVVIDGKFKDTGYSLERAEEKALKIAEAIKQGYPKEEVVKTIEL